MKALIADLARAKVRIMELEAQVRAGKQIIKALTKDRAERLVRGEGDTVSSMGCKLRRNDLLR